MSAAVAIILPSVWAFAKTKTSLRRPRKKRRPVVVSPLAFYSKYTEGLLRRYVKLSMEAGRAPSLLGREMFRGHVTNYRVRSFDDVVIFVHDVDSCLKQLDPTQLQLITRIALQEYTQLEVSCMLDLPIRTLIRRYDRALEQLTRLFLDRGLLEPLVACQEAEIRL